MKILRGMANLSDSGLLPDRRAVLRLQAAADRVDCPMERLRDFILRHTALMAAATAGLAGPAQADSPDPAAAPAALEALGRWLARPVGERPAMADQPFATVALTKAEAEQAKSLLWNDHAALVRTTRTEEMNAGQIVIDGRTLRFEKRVYGEKPESGHSLFISMHGGGGAPTHVNDSQWRNQLRLGDSYHPKEGIYVAPRAPTDTWNLWHEAHIDGLFDRLIQNFIVLEGVNPNRVYLMGYSAGGDGVYQLAPRFADRLAAASMMAGHPNEASPLGLRNIGFALHMGALDSAYNRNKVAREWGDKLAALRAEDPHGYAHQVGMHEGKSHWMELEDRIAIPWMEEFTRNPWPTVIVWRQDDVIHDRFYWLTVPRAEARAGDEIRARLDGPMITLQSNRDLSVSLALDDALLDLDTPVTVKTKDGQTLFAGRATRTLAALHQSLASRGQKPLMAAALVPLPNLPAAAPDKPAATD
ncbi:MAG: alpha/beta hydrolase [Verrucomicrobiales bacterium]